MVGLARAMMSEPKALLLDEPSIGLDPKALAVLAQEMAALNASGMTLILVEQNVRFALSTARRACFLELGRLANDGPSAGFASGGDLLALYFGKGRAAPAPP
jgi:branched-chain amino acid transport system ATP-binding protein